MGIKHRIKKNRDLEQQQGTGGREDLQDGVADAGGRDEGRSTDVFDIEVGSPAASHGSRARSEPIGVELLRDASHYYKHACAVYGWPMHAWMNKSKASCCSVCCGCCACCRPSVWNHPGVQGTPFNVDLNLSIEVR